MVCLLDISYYGEPFSGFARQPEQLTVQGSIEDALKQIYNCEIETTCAGRTDSGVHARHQFVSFDLPDSNIEDKELFAFKLKGSLEQLTHEDIHMNEVKLVDGEFSARHDAKLRKYSYFICNQPTPALFMRNFSWHVPKQLDVKAMKKASKYLLGEHDFKSFCVAASAKDIRTMRNVSEIQFIEYDNYSDHIIEIKVESNAFLHSMVRTMVGTLAKVGLGHREPEWIVEVLEAKDRQAAGDCAPAKGLVLMDVEY